MRDANYIPTAEDAVFELRECATSYDDKMTLEGFDAALVTHDAALIAETIREFEDLYFGPGCHTREWVANTMRKRHGLPPRPGKASQ